MRQQQRETQRKDSRVRAMEQISLEEDLDFKKHLDEIQNKALNNNSSNK